MDLDERYVIRARPVLSELPDRELSLRTPSFSREELTAIPGAFLPPSSAADAATASRDEQSQFEQIINQARLLAEDDRSLRRELSSFDDQLFPPLSPL